MIVISEKLGTARATKELRAFVPPDTWQRIMSYLNQKNVIARNAKIAKFFCE